MSDIIYYGILPLLAIPILLAFARLLLGPKLADRVIAFDLMSTSGIGIITLLAVASRQSAFLDVAAVLALTAFLGTIAFAYYIEARRE